MLKELPLLLDSKEQSEACIVLIPVNQDDISDAMYLAQQLRFSINMPLTIESEGTLKARMKTAHNTAAKYVIFIGAQEKKSNSYRLRDLASGQESVLILSELIRHLNKH